MKQAGKSVDTIAIVNENTDYGSKVGDAIEAEAKKTGLPLAIRIPYSANWFEIPGQVLQLKQANPSVALFVSYASDSILFNAHNESAGLPAADDHRRFARLLHSGVPAGWWGRSRKG